MTTIHRFTWGDAVQVSSRAPADLRPGSIAAVCGIEVVDDPTRARVLDVGVGTTIYLIEFEDGTAAEVREMWLEPLGTT